MPRTARTTTPRGRILAVAGAAAALTAAGTTAAASASAATIPARPATAAVTTAAVTVPAPGLGAGLTINAPRHVLTTTAGASPLAPASTAATPATAVTAAGTGSHGAAVTTTAASHTAKNTGSRHAAAGRHAAVRHHHAGPARPHQMYDSVTPSAIPGGKAVATYADGPYAASPASMAGKNVTWIDTNGTDPKGATVLDVEPGDATPAGAATWASQRLNAHPHGTAVIYTMRSEWAAAQTSVHTLPHWQQHHIRWWIADPTGTPHLVPGSDATQWYWGTHYDISTVNPRF
jgi:hypothetical protein